MANEAVIVELMGQPKGRPVNFTVADSVGIEKGALCYIPATPATGRYASGSYATTAKPFAGIAASEKVANDGSTTIGLWTCGIFDLKTGGDIIALGKGVCLSGANMIRAAVAGDNDTGLTVGTALETSAANDTINVAIGIY